MDDENIRKRIARIQNPGRSSSWITVVRARRLPSKRRTWAEKISLGMTRLSGAYHIRTVPARNERAFTEQEITN
jgi:hypothetical protein